MAQVDLWGATYNSVPAVNLPSGNSTVRFTDTSVTTAVESDVASGKIFIKADGSQGTGTASGGGGGSVTQDQDGYIVLPSTGGGGSPSATQHTIHLEFSDSTDATINAWYDSSFISDAITATTPTTYGQKTVTLAQLDGVTWYEPTPIPLNTQLIDYTAITNDYALNSSGGLDPAQWYAVSDYTAIEPNMTFTYTGLYWGYMGFYDASKQPISTLYMQNDATQRQDDANFGDGILNSTKMPPNTKFVRITTQVNPNDTKLSLIRTA